MVDNVQDWTFTRVVNHLCSKAEERIEFVVKLRYTDLFGETTPLPVTSRMAEISDNMTFEEAITDASATNTVGRHVPRNAELGGFDAISQHDIFFDPREES